MKKFLSLLVGVLFTLTSFGQSPSEIQYGAVNTVTKVGDTLSVEFKYAKKDEGAATLLQFDFEYNNKLMSYLDISWKTPSGASKARNNWSGYKFNPKSNTSESDMDVQYIWWRDEAGNNSYSTSADWSVERITAQTSSAYTDGDQIIVYRFIIKDKFGTSYDSWDNILKVNWANFKQANGTQIQVDRPTSDIDLNGLEGGNAGNVTLNLSSKLLDNNVSDGTDYSYVIKNGAGETKASGDFDASGQAVVSGLENDIQYNVSVSISDLPEYLGEVVTVADLALVFAEAIGAGSGPSGGSTTFDYYIQDIIADVVGTDNKVDFQDSYEILAYLQGVTSGNTNYITKAGTVHEYSGIKETYGAYVNNAVTFANTFTPVDSDSNSKIVNVAHGLRGDVNFSHSYEPSVSSGEKPSSAQNVSSQYRVSMAPGTKFNNSETANIDLVSEIKDGQVIFSINSQIAEMVGSQFNIVYDPNILTLDDVIFDTGNTMTNFANIVEEGKVRVGSFDQNFDATVKQGTPYKLIFNPNEAIQNTSGLISFRVKEGVKADGTQIKFIIE
tara:strand:+ start:1790 stop:3454 length:1665 start_codon:yes stop_codon:yes gene_type:complete